MKKMIIGMVIGVMLASSITSFAGVIFDNNNVKNVSDKFEIYLDNTKLDMYDEKQKEDYKILNYNDRTYVSLRLIAESMNYDSDMWREKYPRFIKLNKLVETDFERKYKVSRLEEAYREKMGGSIETTQFEIRGDVLYIDVYSTGEIVNKYTNVENSTRQIVLNIIDGQDYDFGIKRYEHGGIDIYAGFEINVIRLDDSEYVGFYDNYFGDYY